MSDLKGLIFDVDGTLADTEQEGHRVAFNMAFSDVGLDWYWDENTYGKLLDVFGGKERIRYFVESFPNDFNAPADLDRFIRDVHARKTVHYISLLKSGSIPLRTGVARLIREAREANLRMAIASTTTPENATSLLRETLGEQSIGWFEVLACGDVVPHKKPAPDIYEYTLKQLDLPSSDCLVIEDSESGLKSALGAGLRTLVTINHFTRNHDFAGAEIVLDCLGEPGEAFTVLSGKAGGASWVDVAFLERIHSSP